MMPPDSIATAKRTLFQLGHELPGRRLQRFAEQLLVASQEEPDGASDQLVRRAVASIEDGPTAVVAEEPDLRLARLDPPAVTVEEGATATLEALGHQLVAAYRQS